MTRYKPNDPRDYLAALDFLNYAKENDLEVVLDTYSPPRSGRQNRFLYFCLAYFAHCYNCTEAEAKEIYLKRFACPQIFEQQFTMPNGKVETWYRSTADLSKDEMAMVIRNFRAYADAYNIPIPDSDDKDSIRFCEQQMQRTKHYR